MALIIKVAEIFARIGDAFNEALEARQAAHRKYPFMPEE
jgi:hypothetical protein